jgi:hypothetical protein
MSAPRGPRPPALSWSEAERHALEKWVQWHSTPQLIALRARIVLTMGPRTVLGGYALGVVCRIRLVQRLMSEG